MENKIVIINDNGDATTGEVIKGTAELGQVVTIKLHDEQGMPLEKTGEVVFVV